ncbi:MAG: hypothetical protein LBH00_04150 [Planctomycetaceae bacterium]|jgi:flagellin-like hook-associated protein FlgL|nr:hypothetical protein [Planctomycetaceae bacterium]
MTIVPLGLSRSSVPLQTNRAYSNLGSTTSLLARYEQQLITERQYQYGSDSPFNAASTLTVQSQMERKAQNTANIKSTQTFLAAADSVLSKFNPRTDEAKAMALEALNTNTTPAQRTALAQTVSQTLQGLFDLANNSFGGRYLFSGSSTAAIPFLWGSGSSYTIKFTGNETNLRSWSDTDLLTQSNMSGSMVFGAISDPVRGKTDLDPALTGKTLLSDLNGGTGVDKGTIRFTYTVDNRQQVFDVDLSQCVTIDDVKRTIENSKNPSISISAEITENGLVLSLPPDTAGTVMVSEVGRGTVARQLGIPVNTTFSSGQPLTGKDLNPAITTATMLADLLGTKSSVELRFSGSNNDILIQANCNGTEFNELAVSVQADVAVTPGSEQIEYDAAAGTMLVRIHPDNTSANDIIKAINAASAAGTIPPFTASLTGTDENDASGKHKPAGSGIVALLPGVPVQFGRTSGGSGTDLDLAGLQIVNDNQTFNIPLDQCKTVGDLLAELNHPDYGLYVTINEAKNGIDIRSRVSGADFSIGELGGQTASQLGVRTTDWDTRLEALDYGRGVSDYTGPGTHASAKYVSVSANSTLLLTARNEGTEWNDYTLSFVPTTDPQGKVSVSMDETSKTITIGINPGVTTACDIITAFETQPGPKQFFDLTLDDSNGLNTGSGVVYDGFIKTSGGSDGGIDFTITRNDGVVMNIDIHGAETIEDILRIINSHPANKDGMLTARLAGTGNGIELVDSSIGNKATRVDRTLLSTSAIELGLINNGEEYREKTTAGEHASAAVNTSVLNGSILVKAASVGAYANDAKVEFIDGTPPGFVYDASSKTLRFTIESGKTTANDVIALFENHASEQVRSMFVLQNGVNADGLPGDGSGLIELGTAALAGGVNSELKGNDPNPQETGSLFNALIRMQIAMEKNDTREIERASALLDAAVVKLTESETTLGVIQVSLENTAERLSDETIQYEEVLNTTLRIDYAGVSLNYMNQQLVYQGSMQVTAMMLQMSLLNYL